MAGESRPSPHFTWREFACHDGTPVPLHAHSDVGRLCRSYLEPLRSRYGPVTIISGYRHRSYNAQVGGAPASMHIYRIDRRGAAADIKCARGSPREWFAFLDRMHPGGLGYYPSHVHVDNRVGRARW
jgi:uncharacterized protein YcbK (DUF882 family)